MSGNLFRFKQFAVAHDKSSMKVGTDSVLLGAWANTEGVRNALDVGCGCGIIALMIAQRSKALITAIDIDMQSVKQAQENFDNSPWKDRLQAEPADFREYSIAKVKFDLIISNPPFFTSGIKPDRYNRKLARHADALPLEILLQNASKLLSDDGRINLIIPFDKTTECIRYAATQCLYVSRICNTGASPGRKFSRSLLEFRPKSGEISETVLTIKDINNEFTDSYKVLTTDFYLSF